LTAEGALLPQGNRRVAVPELSAEMLDQVAFARLAIDRSWPNWPPAADARRRSTGWN
jgi:hypothetical protein